MDGKVHSFILLINVFSNAKNWRRILSCRLFCELTGFPVLQTSELLGFSKFLLNLLACFYASSFIPRCSRRRKGIALGITAVMKNAAVQTFSVCFCKALSASLNMAL